MNDAQGSDAPLEDARSPASAAGFAPANGTIPQGPGPAGAVQEPRSSQNDPQVAQVELPALVLRLLKRTLELTREGLPALPKVEVALVKRNYQKFEYGENGNINSTHTY